MFKRIKPQVAINEDGTQVSSVDRFTMRYSLKDKYVDLPREAALNPDGSYLGEEIDIRKTLKWSTGKSLEAHEIDVLKRDLTEALAVLGSKALFIMAPDDHLG